VKIEFSRHGFGRLGFQGAVAVEGGYGCMAASFPTIYTFLNLPDFSRLNKTPKQAPNRKSNLKQALTAISRP
jgi:hypothetical protein